MSMLMDRPASAVAVVGRIGEDLVQLETLKTCVVKGDIHGGSLTELRMQCDRELRELQVEFDTLLGELKLALQRMQAGRRFMRRAA
jgi:hypothetical protein